MWYSGRRTENYHLFSDFLVKIDCNLPDFIRKIYLPGASDEFGHTIWAEIGRRNGIENQSLSSGRHTKIFEWDRSNSDRNFYNVVRYVQCPECRSEAERRAIWPCLPQCCYLAKGAKRSSHTTNTIKLDRIPFDPCNSIKRFDLCPFDQKNSTWLQPPNKLERLSSNLNFEWTMFEFSKNRNKFESLCSNFELSIKRASDISHFI